MKKSVAIITALLIVGAILLCGSIMVGIEIGSEWFGINASAPWHMNNYIVIDGIHAYTFFGLAALALGGLATGIAIPALVGLTKTKSHRATAIVAFFIAIALSGLGFNTLDFMLGSFYWTNMQYPPPVAVPVFGLVDVWNYYFYFFVVPLWLGGFITGVATSYAACKWQPKLPAKLATKRNLGLKLKIPTYLKTTQHKEYTAETQMHTRKHKPQINGSYMAIPTAYNGGSKRIFTNIHPTTDTTTNP
jgi:hypothetical protein